jgi:hypothetical protein
MSQRPSNLRERVRETLAAREPDERAARADLEAVIARKRPRARVRPWVLVTVPAVCALVVVAWSRRAPPPATTRGDDAMAVYIHVAGEPESSALTLQLESTKKNNGAK